MTHLHPPTFSSLCAARFDERVVVRFMPCFLSSGVSSCEQGRGVGNVRPGDRRSGRSECAGNTVVNGGGGAPSLAGCGEDSPSASCTLNERTLRCTTVGVFGVVETGRLLAAVSVCWGGSRMFGRRGAGGGFLGRLTNAGMRRVASPAVDIQLRLIPSSMLHTFARYTCKPAPQSRTPRRLTQQSRLIGEHATGIQHLEP